MLLRIGGSIHFKSPENRGLAQYRPCNTASVSIIPSADRGASSPREVGAAMLVWDGGQSGTIGGGVLEFELVKTALSTDADRLTNHALGPDMGQCCGGAVKVLT